MATAIISFTAPVNDGGAAITSYTVTSSPEDIMATGPTSPINVPGLTPGVEYTFTVVATNAIGDSVPSAPSNAITPPIPATVPDAPTNVVATNDIP